MSYDDACNGNGRAATQGFGTETQTTSYNATYVPSIGSDFSRTSGRLLAVDQGASGFELPPGVYNIQYAALCQVDNAASASLAHRLQVSIEYPVGTAVTFATAPSEAVSAYAYSSVGASATITLPETTNLVKVVLQVTDVVGTFDHLRVAFQYLMITRHGDA